MLYQDGKITQNLSFSTKLRKYSCSIIPKMFCSLCCSNPTIQIDSKGSVEIEGLTEVPISNFTKANWWYAKGRRVRSTSWTNVNEASSRSHWWVRDTMKRFDAFSCSIILFDNDVICFSVVCLV